MPCFPCSGSACRIVCSSPRNDASCCCCCCFLFRIPRSMLMTAFARPPRSSSASGLCSVGPEPVGACRHRIASRGGGRPILAVWRNGSACRIEGLPWGCSSSLGLPEWHGSPLLPVAAHWLTGLRPIIVLQHVVPLASTSCGRQRGRHSRAQPGTAQSRRSNGPTTHAAVQAGPKWPEPNALARAAT